VLYEDFHVETAITAGLTFPSECTDPTMTQRGFRARLLLLDQPAGLRCGDDDSEAACDA
jgi:hypothetical protein